jgi:hypothetical protein
MLHLDYHKGKPCPHKEIICQEGYCFNCVVRLGMLLSFPSRISKQTILKIDKKLNEIIERPGQTKTLQ